MMLHAESAHLRNYDHPPRRAQTCVVLRDVSYQVWRTHMRACVAEYNFRGRVTESEPEPYLATTRPGRKKCTYCPSPIARLFFCPVLAASHLLAAAGSFTPAAMPLLIFLRALFYFWVDRFVIEGHALDLCLMVPRIS